MKINKYSSRNIGKTSLGGRAPPSLDLGAKSVFEVIVITINAIEVKTS
jgi:hypothetical protein